MPTHVSNGVVYGDGCSRRASQADNLSKNTLVLIEAFLLSFRRRRCRRINQNLRSLIMTKRSSSKITKPLWVQDWQNVECTVDERSANEENEGKVIAAYCICWSMRGCVSGSLLHRSTFPTNEARIQMERIEGFTSSQLNRGVSH